MRAGQKANLAKCLPALCVKPASPLENPQRHPVDLETLFPGRDHVWLEIGFGSGEHLLDVASRYPDIGVIGCEPYMNGVASLIGALQGADVSNIRLHPGDVRDLLDVMPSASLDRVYALYPDPWPKLRHHRRRLVSPDYLAPLARVMKPGADLRMATDIGDFARQAVEQIHLSDAFAWMPCDRNSWAKPWPGWHSTRYETKALRNGRAPIYLTFDRL